MKIAIVSLNFHWQSGGNRQIIELARNLKRCGDEVIIYAPALHEGEFTRGKGELKIVKVPFSGTLDWITRPRSIFGKIWRKIEQYRAEVRTCRNIAQAMDLDFDVINPHDYAYATCYFYKRCNPKVRAVYMLNEPPYSYLPKDRWIVDVGSRAYNRLMDFLTKKYFRAIDVTTTLAPYEKKWSEKRGVPGIIVLSGLDFGQFYHPLRNPPIKGETVKLFAVGIPSKYRRYEDVVRAVDLLRRHGYRVAATIVANNLWREDAYCESLKKLAKDLRVEDLVDFRFLGVSEEELKKLYSESHVFVYTNYVAPGRNGSTWALVVSEAQAAGIPVILYKNTGAAEPLSDGVNALLAETEKWEDVAAKTKLLIDDGELFRRIAAGGQNFVKTNISWGAYVGRMRDVFSGKKAQP